MAKGIGWQAGDVYGKAGSSEKRYMVNVDGDYKQFDSEDIRVRN